MILICGESLFDVFVMSGVDRSAGSGPVVLHALAGGSPFNVAVGLARLGREVALCTEFGADALGDELFNILQKEGVDTSAVRRDGATPLALVEAGATDAPRYTFWGLAGRRLHPDNAWLSGDARQIGIIHIGSSALISPVSAGQLLDLIADRSASSLISVDPNVRLQIEPDVTRWRLALERFRRNAHVLKLSTEDVRALYGESADADSIVAEWVTESCPLVVLTKGYAGASIFSVRHGRVDVGAEEASLADTVGAGDSFQAALLSWLEASGRVTPRQLSGLTRDELAAMGEFAARAAAVTCSRKGADLPRWSDLPVRSGTADTLSAPDPDTGQTGARNRQIRSPENTD